MVCSGKGVVFMKVNMKNIGSIQEAEIELNGLTVIAGENDTGKSTVGKTMFAVIRALNKYKHEFDNDLGQYLTDKASDLYFNLRRRVDFEKNPDIRDLVGQTMRNRIG